MLCGSGTALTAAAGPLALLVSTLDERRDEVTTAELQIAVPVTILPPRVGTATHTCLGRHRTKSSLVNTPSKLESPTQVRFNVSPRPADR